MLDGKVVNISDAAQYTNTLDRIETPLSSRPADILARIDYEDLNRDLGLALDVSIMSGCRDNHPEVTLEIDKSVIHDRMALLRKGRAYIEQHPPF